MDSLLEELLENNKEVMENEFDYLFFFIHAFISFEFDNEVMESLIL